MCADDADVLAVEVESDGGYLRTAVRHDGSEIGDDPIQYDGLRIEHDQGHVEIVVYNRAILLFATDSEAVRRIHNVCSRFEDMASIK